VRKILTTISILSIVLVPALALADQTLSVAPNPALTSDSPTISWSGFTGDGFYTGVFSCTLADCSDAVYGNLLVQSAISGSDGSQSISTIGSGISLPLTVGYYGFVIAPFPGAHSCDDLGGLGYSDCITHNIAAGAFGYILQVNAIPPPPPPMIVPMPTDFPNKLTANVSSQLGDLGTLTVLALMAGIPLTFYVIHQLVALMPRRNRKGRNQ
jgi:hypothetical protein